MKVLFLHNNMPGQFKHLARAMGQDPEHEPVFVTRRADVEIPGVRTIVYEPVREATAQTHFYVRTLENAVLRAQQVTRICQSLRRAGFIPDVAIVHPGWGEGLFLREIFPETAILSYCEYYYRAEGGDIGVVRPADLDDLCRLRTRNAHLLLALEDCDLGWSPTQWQKSRHPAALQDRIRVVPDGVDIAVCRPQSDGAVQLPGGRVIKQGQEVITFAARHLEPYRGFHTFMRALPALLQARPNAQVVIVGAETGGYDTPPANGLTWRETLESEISYDRDRVHFVGWLEYRAYLALLQLSAVHVYLTVPFVLSWSFLEAMACGAVLVASDTPPVREVLTHGRTGFMTKFADPDRVARDVVSALESPRRHEISQAARRLIVERYNLADALSAQFALLEEAIERRRRVREDDLAQAG
ncbi:glycosyltransferase family 4 protein [Caulobacter endophyticus]|nr:glycosyltransferase family 4 protein [Caulobacter endophyticus]